MKIQTIVEIYENYPQMHYICVRIFVMEINIVSLQIYTGCTKQLLCLLLFIHRLAFTLHLEALYVNNNGVQLDVIHTGSSRVF